MLHVYNRGSHDDVTRLLLGPNRRRFSYDHCTKRKQCGSSYLEVFESIAQTKDSDRLEDAQYAMKEEELPSKQDKPDRVHGPNNRVALIVIPQISAARIGNNLSPDRIEREDR